MNQEHSIKRKMYQKNIAIGTLGAALLLSSGLTFASAKGNGNMPGRPDTPELQAMHAAVEAGDFTAWQQAIAQLPKAPEALSSFTQDDFDAFVRMHELREDGDLEGAKQIRETLGLPIPEKHGKRMGSLKDVSYDDWAAHMTKRGVAPERITEETFSALQAAAETGDRDTLQALHESLGLPGKPPQGYRGQHRGAILDMTYEEWAAVAADHGFEPEGINQETFSKLQAAATLAQNGDRDAAKALLDDAGIKPPRAERQERFQERGDDDTNDGHRRERSGRMPMGPRNFQQN